MSEKDNRPVTLMYVVRAMGDSIELASVGRPDTGTIIQPNIPPDMIEALCGRHVWVRGGWGDTVTLDGWVPLPTRKGGGNG